MKDKSQPQLERGQLSDGRIESEAQFVKQSEVTEEIISFQEMTLQNDQGITVQQMSLVDEQMDP